MQEKYSFSKLSSFRQCKHGYKLTYIDHKKGIGNCFSSYGILVHSIMERYAKGLLEIWDLVPTYEWEFECSIPEAFPKSKFCNMKETYYKQGLEYLKTFQGYDKFKILDIELKFDLPIDDWLFNGVIDLVYEDEQGRLVLQDYKSKSSFKSKAEQAKYARQLYLYALFLKEKYGKYPDIMRFAMFRKQQLVDIPFDLNGCEEATAWAKETVKSIRECWDYAPACEEFYCENLCNHRKICKERRR